MKEDFVRVSVSRALEKHDGGGATCESGNTKEDAVNLNGESLEKDQGKENKPLMMMTPLDVEADKSSASFVATPTNKKKKDDQTKARARFGSVRVAWHRMTLGSNPGGTGGPPMTLGELEEAERFETLDKFSETFHQSNNNNNGRKKRMYRMSKVQRRDIALQHHTEEEIARVEREDLEIRENRLRSSKECEDGSIKAIIAQKKKESEEKKKLTKKKSGLFSCFGR